MTRLLLTIAVAAAALAAEARAGALDDIRASATVRIAYRADAAPMSFRSGIGEPAGFTVNLCHEVAGELKAQLGLPKLEVAYVPVTAQDRFDAIAERRADMLCEATTATLARRQTVDFSLPTFIDGASVMVRDGGPGNFEGLAGEKIGVVRGTTTEASLRATLARTQVGAEVVPVADHGSGIDLLKSGQIAAYFADRIILMSLAAAAGDAKFALSPRYLTHETYALALPKDDGAFRLAVDRALSRLYRSGAVRDIFAAAFGAGTAPSDMLTALYLINGLPE